MVFSPIKNLPEGKYISNYFVLFVIGLCSMVYAPGLNGPFIFDDITVITSNNFLTISQLDFSSLYHAATSSESGPLGRPVSMISFALNYYFSDGFNNTFPFKVTNLVIHSTNSFLLFLIIRLLLNNRNKEDSVNTKQSTLNNDLISLAIAILWLIHPIQINSVHYTVQRMTTLSGFFVLLGLLAYISGRILYRRHDYRGRILIGLCVPLCLILGLYSKENAVLLIPFIAIVEYFLFPNSLIWTKLNGIDRRVRYSLIVTFVITLIGVLVLYSLPGYSNREFSLLERLLTEFRVLAFYISLIFLPILNRFGLFHDDFLVSTGLLDPISTLYSIIFLSAMLFLAIKSRKKYPYLAFGIIWFFTAHSLESTFIALELVHEHRNYLAIIGPILAVASLIASTLVDKNKYLTYFITALLLLTLGSVTFLRSQDWSNKSRLIISESTFHPNSPRAQGALGSLNVEIGDFAKGLVAMENAHMLQPRELGYLLNMAIINHWSGRTIPSTWEEKLYFISKNEMLTPLSLDVLRYAVNCSANNCRTLRPVVKNILDICISRPILQRRYRAQCEYYKGSILLLQKDYRPAINSFDAAYRLDSNLILALLGIGRTYIESENFKAFDTFLIRLNKANERTNYSRDPEVRHLIYKYNQAKNKPHG